MKMEKVCEYCTSLRPIVYCKADAAQLCLFCDVKVHSANSLSNRHPRALLCELCKYRPAYVRCSYHKKFMCRGCDCSLHEDACQHQKKMVNSYMGCPSAKDFALLWGFEMNKVDNGNSEIFKCTPYEEQARGNALESQRRNVISTNSAKSEIRLNRKRTEVFSKDNQNQYTCTILQQIIDLEKLQLNEGHNGSSFIPGNQRFDVSASVHNSSWKLDKCLQHTFSVETDTNQEIKIEPFTSSFQPLEDFTSSTTVDSSQEEPFWQSGTQDHDFEMWSENLQDLGICEDSVFFDKSNVPDVDVSFRNFEELFTCDEGTNTALLDEKISTTSSLENDMISLCKLDHDYAHGVEDSRATSSVFSLHSVDLDKESGLGSTYFGSEGCSSPIQMPYSTMSPSFSRLSDNSNSTTYMDTNYSTLVVTPEEPCNPSQPKSTKVEGKGRSPLRCKDKKNATRYKKQGKGSCSKNMADRRKRGRS